MINGTQAVTEVDLAEVDSTSAKGNLKPKTKSKKAAVVKPQDNATIELKREIYLKSIEELRAGISGLRTALYQNAATTGIQGINADRINAIRGIIAQDEISLHNYLLRLSKLSK